MKKEELRQMIREELKAALQEQSKNWWHKPAEAESKPHIQPDQMHEKSVPQPYDRKGARKMSKSQIELRKKIGDSMMGDEKKVSEFRKKYGDDWESYLWAAASSAAFRQKGSSKSDDKKKK